ncbi:PadR family transcriptional regulator [Cellulomonas triticagri]|uniref:PadR family transcriptional regulator n=1 Tax=Cellulomonas triticagri TaxID=2483352 RepID=A0A3M2JB55_9CELL|nr:PadR family transcriptional regulator [Cellulomonas triticagri]RMI08743.1 PadR family transcriptional regulator [Cellulomonas triticagri]
MPPVFAHGQLRLYLLSLLAAGPRHGYELITALSERFGGTYRPSAGTVYPRLARLEDEGLVSRTAAGRRTLYALTERGRAELDAHRDDLAALERELADTVRDLASRVRAEATGAMAGLRAEVASAAQRARAAAADGARPAGSPGPGAGRGGGATLRVDVEAELARFRADVRAMVRDADARGELTALTADTVRSVLASAREAVRATLPPR